jgi:predicted GH43/DUF377 family glycosyl hydrolase
MKNRYLFTTLLTALTLSLHSDPFVYLDKEGVYELYFRDNSFDFFEDGSGLPDYTDESEHPHYTDGSGLPDCADGSGLPNDTGGETPDCPSIPSIPHHPDKPGVPICTNDSGSPLPPCTDGSGIPDCPDEPELPCHVVDCGCGLPDYTDGSGIPDELKDEDLTDYWATLDQSDLIDLDEGAQDFILETKRIEIPGFPHAFNPSIVRWRGSFLMSFRIYNPINGFSNYIGLVRLDEDFNIIGSPKVLRTRVYDPFIPYKRQDPRLITIGERLYIVYNDILEGKLNPEIRRMHIAEVHFDGVKFFTDVPECLSSFDGERKERWEKNWVPFEYDGNLLLAYSIVPHVILNPHLGTGNCETVAATRSAVEWKWGTPRGGTCAFVDGDKYLAFFHSSILMATKHSQGKTVRHYFVGAYTFDLHPPFAITAISPEPIIGKNFYNGLAYKTWQPLHVVFPGGFVFDDNHVWVVYGRQDHETWVAKLDKKALLNSLVPTKR